MNATSTYVRIVLGIVSSVGCSDVSSCGVRRDRDFASCEEGESGGREFRSGRSLSDERLASA